MMTLSSLHSVVFTDVQNSELVFYVSFKYLHVATEKLIFLYGELTETRFSKIIPV